ncbi:cryptochrome/photolyase family protein [Mucilaginibacter antarcticus]|uniref:Cryptochrome/photolyase family protein n=1 Tax=Mucilaginibacter antarcticus TaxID=1855725 RepID=A0ABW5XPQ6_9SPHI
MNNKTTIFWFRRDLRLDDNAGLYRALKSDNPVLCLFIFDPAILDQLDDKQDARVTFIYDTTKNLQQELEKHNSSLLVLYSTVEMAWQQVLKDYDVAAVYTNHDYEPYAKKRDEAVAELLTRHGISFNTFKDQVIFERAEITKDDGKPYTVFTPYSRKWKQKLNDFYLKSYPTRIYLKHLLKTAPLPMPTLQDIGFKRSLQTIPDKNYEPYIIDYAAKRDYPAIKGTTRIGIHLRFGTVSIRKAATYASEVHEKTWLNELIWREFYMMILHHFPQTQDHAFRPEYDRIKWINNEKHFEAWCQGKTGYPLVDAGMRELNATGFMHNRVRMLTASFLSKHLLIDWRWGERYFASKLLDYEMASNVGGWQWAAGSGTDAAPYFRIFSPDAQTKRFDLKMEYIKKWVPEYADFSKYPKPIVDHAFARDRCLSAFKEALSK